MTGEGVTADSSQLVDADAPMHCYRHPDRETRVSCGRCDRPICTRCAMQGPVGFRCRQCGSLAYDPMTSLRPTQAALGLLVATGLGAVIGFLVGQFGIIGIFVGFFGGGIIAEAVTRVVGYKRGPYIITVVVVGIIAGVLLGYGLNFWLTYLSSPFVMAALNEAGMSAFSLLSSEIAFPLISMVAAAAGAYTRLR